MGTEELGAITESVGGNGIFQSVSELADVGFIEGLLCSGLLCGGRLCSGLLCGGLLCGNPLRGGLLCGGWGWSWGWGDTRKYTGPKNT